MHQHTLRSGLRFMVTAWRLQMKLMSVTATYIFVSIILPIILAASAYFIFRGSSAPTSTTMVVVGGGLLGMWSVTLFGSGAAVTRQRATGTLESLVAAPTPFVMTLAPLTVATATMGVYSIAATLGWAALFGIPLRIDDPAAFAVSVIGTVISVGLLGMLLAVAFVLYPAAQALSNLAQYPLWLFSGALVPLDHLPHWAEVCAAPLGPSWGVKAVRASVEGGDVLQPLLVSVALGLCYLVLTLVLLRVVEWRARQAATLALS
jgi:ABC-2 type transport system permease protein